VQQVQDVVEPVAVEALRSHESARPRVSFEHDCGVTERQRRGKAGDTTTEDERIDVQHVRQSGADSPACR